MVQLSEDQLNHLGKEALVIIVASLQDQPAALQSQLDVANAQLSDNNCSIAQEAYDRVTEMMYINNGFDDLSVSNRKKQRQLVLSEKVDAYFAWIKLKYAQVTQSTDRMPLPI